MLVYNFDKLNFSSDIPDLTFRLDDGETALDFELYVRGETLLKERYYATSKFVTVRNIRAVIEQYMRTHEICYTTFFIQTDTDSVDFDVVYCGYANRNMKAEEFLLTNFMTTTKVKRIAADGRDRLSFIAQSGESATYYIYGTFNVGDSSDIATYGITCNPNTILTETELVEIEISIPQLIAALKNKVGSDITLRTITVKASDRSMTYFIESQQPTDVFFFRNIFNVVEMAQLNCVTTEKTEVSRSLAVCNGIASFYDQSTEKTYEVETAPLLLEEARWLNQMLHSHEVRHSPLNSYEIDDEIGTQAKILITEMTSEIQNGDSQLNTLKFTYRYEDERPMIYFDEEQSIFDEPFTDPYA